MSNEKSKSSEMKTFNIYVPREVTFEIDVEAESLEEAEKIAERRLQEAGGKPASGIKALSSRWIAPSERPWLIVERPKKKPPQGADAAGDEHV